MPAWNAAPLFRLLLPLVAGIILRIQFPYIGLGTALWLSAAFLTFSLLLHWRFSSLHVHLRWLSGCTIILLCFFTGISAVNVNQLQEQPGFFDKIAEDSDILLLRLIEPSVVKERGLRTLFKVEGVYNGNNFRPATGKVILYLAKDTASAALRYGDKILVANKLKRLEPPKNPDEFNFSRYMAYHQVYHTAFISGNDWKFAASHSANTLWESTYRLKETLLHYLDQELIEKDERGIAKALVLGQTDELQPHLLAAYAGTGTMHILSVSGLHIGMIFLVLNWLTRYMNKNRKARLIRTGVIILILWGYALLTGLSPSVLRSVTMFSFLTVGTTLGRITNIYNTIAASAMVMLLLDPFLIMQVGFQLSYVAVIGIVWLHPINV